MPLLCVYIFSIETEKIVLFASLVFYSVEMKNGRKSEWSGKKETSLQTEVSHYILKTSIFFFFFFFFISCHVAGLCCSICVLYQDLESGLHFGKCPIATNSIHTRTHTHTLTFDTYVSKSLVLYIVEYIFYAVVNVEA